MTDHAHTQNQCLCALLHKYCAARDFPGHHEEPPEGLLLDFRLPEESDSFTLSHRGAASPVGRPSLPGAHVLQQRREYRIGGLRHGVPSLGDEGEGFLLPRLTPTFVLPSSGAERQETVRGEQAPAYTGQLYVFLRREGDTNISQRLHSQVI
jgi:hypothetical protein